MIANYFWHGIHVKQALILFTFLIVHLFIIILFYLFKCFQQAPTANEKRRLLRSEKSATFPPNFR